MSDPLTQAQDLVDRIFQATAGLQMTGLKEAEEQESEAYAKLMEEREPWVAQLTALKEKLTPTQRASAQFERIRQVIVDITALDKAQLATVQQMQDAMRGSIKDMKSGRKMASAYSAYAEDSRVGFFDKRQ